MTKDCHLHCTGEKTEAGHRKCFAQISWGRGEAESGAGQPIMGCPSDMGCLGGSGEESTPRHPVYNSQGHLRKEGHISRSWLTKESSLKPGPVMLTG